MALVVSNLLGICSSVLTVTLVVCVPCFQWAQGRKGTTLSPVEFARIEDSITGQRRNEVGPKLVFLNAYESIKWHTQCIALKHNQYVKLLDEQTGNIRVEVGEQVVYPTPTEVVLDVDKATKCGIKNAVSIDDDTAALIRNTSSGEMVLITAKGMFVPQYNEEIVKIRKLIKLEDHQTMIIISPDGGYQFKSGANEDERSFFLPPYCSILTQNWSTGINDDKQQITRVDSRPQYLSYSFVSRTSDNVDLVIDITFFWQVIDVEAMIKNTDDAPGDVCAHARSLIIQRVSQTDLEKFMSGFNEIVGGAILDCHDDAFFDDRGLKVHSVEVRSISCKDPETERVLQEIIQETTNRMKRLQQIQSENEVRLVKTQGDIEQEKLNGNLLEIRHDHQRRASQIEGEAEADRVRSFLDGISTNLPYEKRMEIFNMLCKVDAMKQLGTNSSANLYFTPSDVNLSIETHSK